MKHAIKACVFDSLGLISTQKKFWGVFYGKGSTVFEPQQIVKPLYAKDAHKILFFHIFQVLFYQKLNLQGVFGVFDT